MATGEEPEPVCQPKRHGDGAGGAPNLQPRSRASRRVVDEIPNPSMPLRAATGSSGPAKDEEAISSASSDAKNDDTLASYLACLDFWTLQRQADATGIWKYWRGKGEKVTRETRELPRSSINTRCTES
ncbi:hypothetical protein E4U21_001486 [Claviceps maximensis]|nr:hypothetical protein E4U21_001486 [Claviceps maximensis]